MLRTLTIGFVLAVLVIPTHAMEKGIQDGWAVDDSDGVLLTAHVAREMRECGARWVRLHFRLNAKHRTWEEPLLAAYAEAVRNLEREHLRIPGLLTYESRQGSQAEWIANNHEVVGGNGDSPWLRSLIQQDFRLLLRRFPRVTHWEIWNEPNCWTQNPPGNKDKLPGQFFIYPSNFAWLLRRAYEEARSAGHPVSIVSGGLLGADFTGKPDADVAVPYLRDTVKMGREYAGWDDLRKRFGTWPADGWGLHLYVRDAGKVTADYFSPFPAAFVKAVEEIESGPTRKQVWITEIGYHTKKGGLSEVDQAADINVVLDALHRMPGIGPVTWFKLHDEPAADLFYGLRRADDTPKPAWVAFRKAVTVQSR